MDDAMIDLTLGDGELRRRLEAYADARLSPEPASAARLRARVLAIAHRQAELRRGDALTIVPSSVHREPVAPLGAGRRDRRAAAALLAATIALAGIAGTVAAARPAGPLYEARLWVETLTLPAEPSDRALAELDRLELRLHEAESAAAGGDLRAVTEALAAYARIVDQAAAAAATVDDPVAEAALGAGVGRNIAVLQALAGLVPQTAADAIGRAVERAIARSDAAIDAVGPNRPGRGDGAGGPATPAATPKPTRAPTPTSGPIDPVAEPTAKPTPKGDKPDKPQPTPRRTPKTP